MNQRTNHRNSAAHWRKLLSTICSKSFGQLADFLPINYGSFDPRDEYDSKARSRVVPGSSILDELHRIEPGAVGLLRGLGAQYKTASSVVWRNHKKRHPGAAVVKSNSHCSGSLSIVPSIVDGPFELAAWKLMVEFKINSGNFRVDKPSD